MVELLRDMVAFIVCLPVKQQRTSHTAFLNRFLSMWRYDVQCDVYHRLQPCQLRIQFLKGRSSKRGQCPSPLTVSLKPFVVVMKMVVGVLELSHWCSRCAQIWNPVFFNGRIFQLDVKCLTTICLAPL